LTTTLHEACDGRDREHAEDAEHADWLDAGEAAPVDRAGAALRERHRPAAEQGGLELDGSPPPGERAHTTAS
jgi:hypothetical protein